MKEKLILENKFTNLRCEKETMYNWDKMLQQNLMRHTYSLTSMTLGDIHPGRRLLSGCLSSLRTIHDRTNKRRFMIFLVQDRTRDTLDQIIINFIHRDCPLLCSDSFSSYRHLRQCYRLNHYMVNHKKNFVNPIMINVTQAGCTYKDVKIHT